MNGRSKDSRRGDGPDFMCVGAQKGGTQWLYDQLAMHPQFWMPAVKELHYFDLPGSRKKKAERIRRLATADLADYNAARKKARRRPLDDRDLAFLDAFIDLPKRIDIEAYARLFDGKGEAIAGDITPGYSGLTAETTAAIAARFPALKVIYIARNPVDRFWSAFNMRVRKGDIPATMDIAAAKAFAERGGVKRRSSPSQAVRTWREAMPEGQFALFFFDDLVATPSKLRRRILRFLDASPELSGPVAGKFNRKERRQKVTMSDDMRAAISAMFADELKACAEQLGGPAETWAAGLRG